MKARIGAVLAACLLGAGIAWADALDLPAPSADDLKPNVPQPYIVKPGDTLWDIAKHFFKDPHKWIRIWERNLYITNPDLIYPGNEIWFDVQAKRTGGLKVVRVEPKVVVKPVERAEDPNENTIVRQALKRQDFILSAEELAEAGYVLDSPDERLHYGAGDRIYVRLARPARPGRLLDIFRPSRTIRHPHTGKPVGVLVVHLGRARLIEPSGNVWRARIVESFAEIDRGDRLQPAFTVPEQLAPRFIGGRHDGVVLYIRDDAAEAGQHQVIGIDLGIDDGMQPGVMLSVHRQGRVTTDRRTGEEIRLPEEKIAEIMVLVPQKRASIAIVTDSTAAVHVGDVVHNAANR